MDRSTKHSHSFTTHDLLGGLRTGVVGCALLGAVGAFAGGCSNQPAASSSSESLRQPIGYRAHRLVSIRAVETDDPPLVEPALRSAFINAEIARLSSDKLIREAINDPCVQTLHPCQPTDQEIGQFLDNLTVELKPKSNSIILVSYTATGKNAEALAKTFVDALLSAYEKESGRDKVVAAAQKKKLYWQNESEALQRKIEALHKLIQEDSKLTDGDPAALRKYEDTLASHELNLQSMKRDYEAAKLTIADAAKKETTPEEWAQADQTMRKRIQMRDDMKRIVAALTAQLAPNHHSVLDRKDELAVIEKEIAEYAKELSGKYVLQRKPDGSAPALLSRDLKPMEQATKDMEKQVSEERSRVEKIRVVAARIAYNKTLIDQTTARLAEAQEAAREWDERAKTVPVAVAMGEEASVEPVYSNKQ